MADHRREERLTRTELQRLLQAVIDEVSRRPPVIGLVGVSGVGKSSTINSLFRTSLATSDTVACTKEFSYNAVETTVSKGGYTRTAILHVVDAPGLGEDVQRDPDYVAMYEENLPSCDVILWVLTARNRAVALDQMYLKQLSRFHERIVFGLNQVDLLEPMDWDQSINLPSRRQLENLEVIIADRSAKLRSALGRDVRVIPYSARCRYNLPVLFSAILDSCPANRAWVFDAMKGFRYDDFVPAHLREIVARKLSERASQSSAPQPGDETGPLVVPAPGLPGTGSARDSNGQLHGTSEVRVSPGSVTSMPGVAACQSSIGEPMSSNAYPLLPSAPPLGRALCRIFSAVNPSRNGRRHVRGSE
jgi:predicted GTPase